MVDERGDAMVKVEMDEVGLLAAIDALKRVSPEQQEAAILELEGEHPGIGERVRALLAIEKQTAEHIARLEKARVEPKSVAAPNSLLKNSKSDVRCAIFESKA